MEKWQKVPEGKFEKEPVVGTSSFMNERGEYNIDGKVLVRKWNSKAKWFMTLFSSFWCGFIGLTISMTWNGPITVNGTYHDSIQHAFRADPVTAVFSIFPLVGIIMGYITLTMWVNKTTIKYSSGTLEILRGPLPWRNSHVVVRGNNILQCWVEMYSSYTKNDVPVYSFRVKASRSRGKPLIIENGLRTYYEARVLEQWLENHLNIDDEYVPGEHVA